MYIRFKMGSELIPSLQLNISGLHYRNMFSDTMYNDSEDDGAQFREEIYYHLENSSILMNQLDRNEKAAVSTPADNFQNTNFENDVSPVEEESGQLFEIPVSMTILLFLLYGAICVTAVVGNALVLGLAMCSGKMRTVTNLFIANLALSDIIIGLFTIPFQFQAALLQRWDLPHFLCALCPFVQVLSVNVSVFTLSAIAVDRYRAVMHPLKVQASKIKASWLILSIWIVGFLLALPTEFDYQVTFIPSDNGELKPFCANNVWLSPQIRMHYNQSIVVLQYFLPLCIITGAYIRMGRKLWKNQSPGNKEESRDALLLRNKKKVIKMLSLVVILFALCWFPLQTYNFLQYVFPSINTFYYINVLWFTWHLLAMGNSCCNPFVYAIYNEKFRQEFRSFRMGCYPQKRERQCEQISEENEHTVNINVGLYKQPSGNSSQESGRSENDREKLFNSSSSRSKIDKAIKNACDVPQIDTKCGHSSEGAIHERVMKEKQQTDCYIKVHNNMKNSCSFPIPQGFLKKFEASVVEDFV